MQSNKYQNKSVCQESRHRNWSQEPDKKIKRSLVNLKKWDKREVRWGTLNQ